MKQKAFFIIFKVLSFLEGESPTLNEKERLTAQSIQNSKILFTVLSLAKDL